MAKPISSEKRADIIRHMESGRSKAEIAEWLFVCVRAITRVWDKYTRLAPIYRTFQGDSPAAYEAKT